MEGFVRMSQALGQYLDRQGLAHLACEETLRQRWPEVMGGRAAELAGLESLRDWVLRVRVRDAAWRNELHYQRDGIRDRANAVLGRPVVKDVVLL